MPRNAKKSSSQYSSQFMRTQFILNNIFIIIFIYNSVKNISNKHFIKTELFRERLESIFILLIIRGVHSKQYE